MIGRLGDLDPETICAGCHDAAGQHISDNFDRLICPVTWGERTVGIEPETFVEPCRSCAGDGWDLTDSDSFVCPTCKGRGRL